MDRIFGLRKILFLMLSNMLVCTGFVSGLCPAVHAAQCKRTAAITEKIYCAVVRPRVIDDRVVYTLSPILLLFTAIASKRVNL